MWYSLHFKKEVWGEALFGTLKVANLSFPGFSGGSMDGVVYVKHTQLFQRCFIFA